MPVGDHVEAVYGDLVQHRREDLLIAAVAARSQFDQVLHVTMYPPFEAIGRGFVIQLGVDDGLGFTRGRAREIVPAAGSRWSHKRLIKKIGHAVGASQFKLEIAASGIVGCGPPYITVHLVAPVIVTGRHRIHYLGNSNTCVLLVHDPVPRRPQRRPKLRITGRLLVRLVLRRQPYPYLVVGQVLFFRPSQTGTVAELVHLPGTTPLTQRGVVTRFCRLHLPQRVEVGKFRYCVLAGRQHIESRGTAVYAVTVRISIVVLPGTVGGGRDIRPCGPGPVAVVAAV